MSSNSDRLIDSLNDFTSALEDLVDVLKKQSKNNSTELLDKIVSSFDGDALNSVVKDIKEIKENVININKNTDKILTVVKDQKKQKETGIASTLEEKSSKDKIIGAVKTVVLIAAGVLAIGMAFKIVGDVDFVSVVSLGLGIMFVAHAFAKVASIKDDDGKALTYKSALKTSAIMTLMSGAILVSGVILKMMPIISPATLLTIAGVGVAIGLSTYFVLKAVGNLKPKDLKSAFLVPVLLPLVAGGIVGAGYVLSAMPEVSAKQLLTALGVGIALAPIFLSVGYMIKNLKNAKMSDILMVAAIMPLISTGILLSSIILNYVQDISLITVLEAGIGVGLSTLSMIPTIFLLKQMGLTKPSAILELTIAIGSIVLISTALMASSWILTMGNYSDNYPSIEWGAGVGLSILAFSIPMAIIGAFAMSGVGLAALSLAMLAVPLVVLTIVGASLLLPLGKYDEGSYPSVDWATGVGLSILSFSIPMMLLGTIIFASFGLGLLALASGLSGVLLIADAIQQSSHILGKGNYSIYPTAEWTAGVGGAILAFAKALEIQNSLNLINSFFGGEENDLAAFITKISSSILVAGKLFASSNGLWNEGNYPSKDWADGVGNSILAFAKALEIQNSLNLINSFFAIPKTDLATFIKRISMAILLAGELFSGSEGIWNENSHPSKDWADGVGGSILAFAKALEIEENIKTGFFADPKADLAEFIKNISIAIIAAGKVFSIAGNGLWNEGTYPSKDWADGVGGSILAFAKAIQALDDAGLDIDADDLYGDDGAIAVMLGLSLGIIKVGLLFSKLGKPEYWDLTFIPSSDWGTQISDVFNSISNMDLNFDKIKEFYYSSIYLLGAAKWLSRIGHYKFDDSITNFTNAVKQIIEVLPGKDVVEPFLLLVKGFKDLSNVSWTELLSINQVGDAIKSIAKDINELNENNVNSLLKLGAGFQMMSLIDDKKLLKILDVIDEKTEVLSEMTDENGYFKDFFENIFTNNKQTINNKQNQQSSNNSTSGAVVEEFSPFENKLLSHIKKIDENIESMVTSEKEEEEKEEELKSKDISMN